MVIAIKQLRVARSFVPDAQLSVRELKKVRYKYHFLKRCHGEIAPRSCGRAMHRKSI